LPVKPTDNLLLLTQLGYGKSFPVESLRLGVLGDIGTTAMQFSGETDRLVAILPYLAEQRLLLLTNHNRQISVSSEDFNVWSKDGVGDRLIELERDELINLAVLNVSSNGSTENVLPS
jgi:DNA gyrase subunit A